MKYTVKGKLNEIVYTVTYQKGLSGKAELTGDLVAVRLIEIRAASSRPVGPVGMYFDSNLLENPLAALFVMREVFNEIIEASGDVPEAPAIPDGAIG
jgi:hypothetical protein